MTPAPSATTTTAPPIFARLQSNDGKVIERLLEAPSESGETCSKDLVGDWWCDALAPGGMKAHGPISIEAGERPDRSYESVCALFQGSHALQLWLSPVSKHYCLDVDIELRGSQLAVWNAHEIIASDLDWSMREVTSEPCWLVFSPSASAKDPSENYFVQYAAHDAPSIFAVLRKHDRLAFEPGPGPELSYVDTLVMSPPGLHTAYWAFLRMRDAEAANATAHRLCSKVLDHGLKGHDELIACSHAMVRTRTRWADAGRMKEHLATALLSSPDARVMDWIFAFDMRDPGAAARLPEIVDQFVATKPVYSGTFRLFYQRLKAAFSQVEKSRSDWSALDEGVRYIHNLARSTHWDAEHLSYSGRSPAQPEPHPAISGALKKKDLRTEIARTISARLAHPPGVSPHWPEPSPTVTVEQTKSSTRRPSDQAATLVGLGLGRIGKRRTLIDTPATQGMIRKVSHLVKVEKKEERPAPPVDMKIAAE